MIIEMNGKMLKIFQRYQVPGLCYVRYANCVNSVEKEIKEELDWLEWADDLIYKKHRNPDRPHRVLTEILGEYKMVGFGNKTYGANFHVYGNDISKINLEMIKECFVKIFSNSNNIGLLEGKCKTFLIENNSFIPKSEMIKLLKQLGVLLKCDFILVTNSTKTELVRILGDINWRNGKLLEAITS